MEDATIQKLWIDTLFHGTKIVKLMSYIRLEFNTDFKHQGMSWYMLNEIWNHNNYKRKFWDNSKCKCDQEKAILDGIEFRVSKMIYKNIKVDGLWGWGFVCSSVCLSIIGSAIVANAFSSDLKTHKSQIFPMIAPGGVAKQRTSPKATIFPPPVPDYFISDQCLKGNRWTTLFLRYSIVAMDL